MKVIKRDGQLVNYDRKKIVSAIENSFICSTGCSVISTVVYSGSLNSPLEVPDIAVTMLIALSSFRPSAIPNRIFPFKNTIL